MMNISVFDLRTIFYCNLCSDTKNNGVLLKPILLQVVLFELVKNTMY